ncbi:ead/Ea22-like family protein [Pseudomonas putida]|uniref:ead/Ea22-like family protein n=1 Tax=Pseudomonas putida TaxID=303 RepID=UPI0018D5DE07|nr:ead/Ea22-like family protein [Pseudomonas putida]MBH3452657.1 ead/Ea22-like family protein [Pseudomonas putida]
MDTNKMRDLKELAEAATAGEWTCSDKHDGRFWHIQAGSQAIGATHAAGRKSPMAGVFEANARFIAAASPATVLALLAEIDDQALQARSAREVCLESQAAILSLISERDQLKAENAQLKNQEIELKAENEALRKDAERYRFVRKTWCPDWPSEKADAQIDAAMAKEASHG